MGADARLLKGLVAVNLMASGAHFAHNAVLLDTYPGPDWIPGPWFVVSAWLLVATALLLGYRWHLRGDLGRARAAVLAYCASCLLVFGHYAYGSPADFDLLANALIVLEGTAGLVLLVYYVLFAGRGQGRTP